MVRLTSRLRWGGAALVVVLLLGVFLPPVRTRLVAGVTLADALGVGVPRPLAASVERRRTAVGGVTGDLYTPGSGGPSVVVVPGATRAGARDARVVRLARALAGSRREVFVPVLDVYRRELLPADVDRIVRAATALADWGRVTVLGFSFGGSLALLAAADRGLEGRLALVATFGAYTDLVGVVQAATTGVSLVGGRRIPWPAHPRAEEIVREHLVGLLPAAQRDPLRRALDGRGDPEGLPAAARSAYRLLTHRDPARTGALAAGLPVGVRRRLAEMSPSSVLHRITVPVIAMHAVDDPVIPYGELLRLGAALPEARLLTTDGFQHVDLDLSSPASWWRALDDLATAWRFTTALLEAQGGRWPWSLDRLSGGPAAALASPAPPPSHTRARPPVRRGTWRVRSHRGSRGVTSRDSPAAARSARSRPGPQSRP